MRNRITSGIRIIAILVAMLSCALAEGIKGDVYVLGVALDQEGAAGGWAQVGPDAAWKATIAGTILQGRMYTVESDGTLYATNLKTGAWEPLGKPVFRNTRFMLAEGTELYTVESTGNLYHVNPANGGRKQVGPDGAWKATIAATVLGSGIYTIESTGALYWTNLDTGGWRHIGKAEFADTRFLFGSGNSLYTIEADGSLYRVSPHDGSWARVGAAASWKGTIRGTVINGRLYTAEQDGKLYSTDLGSGQRASVGKAEFAGTRFMFPSGAKLYTIEESGNLYRVEPNTGRIIDEYNWCVDEIEKVFREQGGGLSHALHARKILGEKATKAAILDGMNWLRTETKPDDLVVVYLGAHGKTDPKAGWGIATADLKQLWGHEVKKHLGQLPCGVLLLIETCESGGFAEAHADDPPVPSNVTVLCACAANEVTNNPLDLAVGEALYGRADFNHDGVVVLDELIEYVRIRYKEFWPKSGEGSNTPVIVRGNKISGSLALTKASKALCAVAVNDDFWSALDEGQQGDRFKIHVLGWSSEPGRSYFRANSATRDQICLPGDGAPLLVEQKGHWRAARLLHAEKGTFTIRYLGNHPAEEQVTSERIRYPFAGKR